ncbi:MAG TPA: hypothetical protein VM934_00960 [Pyrinomonadaceae bacterium]|nr:hypothetical protein [Pyrinomonadaceae bacterium]
MRASQIIILYLATAAPFGVAYFLRGQVGGASSAWFLARAFVAAMLWPFTALRYALRQKHSDGGSKGAADQSGADERKVEAAKRALVNSLRETEELLTNAGVLKDEAGRHALFAARESVERYVGLTLVAAGARTDDAPSARELELCRIAGRAGEDLLAAGRCVHRRNVERLVAHRERARAGMLHTLAGVRELARDFFDKSLPARDEARLVSEKLLRTFAHAIELYSLLDDWQAAIVSARLLDAECARLRRLEAEEFEVSTAGLREGRETCSTILEASAT